MNTYIVKLRKSYTQKILLTHIVRFLKRGNFDSRYIKIQVKIYTNNNSVENIGETIVLDTKNMNDIKRYKLFVQHSFLAFIHANKDIEIHQIIFDYISLNRKGYLNYFKEFNFND